MSRVFITASKDTSIYEKYPYNNAGGDEILEIGKLENFGLYLPVRSLIQFNLDDIQSAPTNSAAILTFKTALVEKLKSDEMLYVYPVSTSWTEGTGYFEQVPYNSRDGATWKHNSSGSYWVTSGSDYLTSPAVSCSLNNVSEQDLRIDVSTIIQPMLSGSLDNKGLLLKLSDVSENDDANKVLLKVFSRQTHTVHEPVLELAWMNQTFSTGSLDPIPSFNIHIAPLDLKSNYKKGSIFKLYFIVRDKYPPKNYANTMRYSNKYYLPSGSIFGVWDAAAGTVVTPMDQYSHIDTDSLGSYITIDTRHMFKNRFYDIQVRSELNGEVWYSPKYRFAVR